MSSLRTTACDALIVPREYYLKCIILFFITSVFSLNAHEIEDYCRARNGIWKLEVI